MIRRTPSPQPSPPGGEGTKAPPPAADLTRHWIAKGLAGLVLGLVIAIGVSGLIAWAAPGGIAAPGKYQVMMWAVLPVWMLVLTFCFLFRSVWRACLWLAATAILLHAALIACQHWL